MVEENKINDDTNKKDKKKNVVAENIKMKMILLKYI